LRNRCSRSKFGDPKSVLRVVGNTGNKTACGRMYLFATSSVPGHVSDGLSCGNRGVRGKCQPSLAIDVGAIAGPPQRFASISEAGTMQLRARASARSPSRPNSRALGESSASESVFRGLPEIRSQFVRSCGRTPALQTDREGRAFIGVRAAVPSLDRYRDRHD